MSPTDPNVQVLIELVSGVHARLDRQDVELAEIKSQVKETNGRVGALERWRIRRDAVAEDRQKQSDEKDAHVTAWRIGLAGAALSGPVTVVLAHFVR